MGTVDSQGLNAGLGTPNSVPFPLWQQPCSDTTAIKKREVLRYSAKEIFVFSLFCDSLK